MVTALDRLDGTALDAIAALCSRGIVDSPSVEELRDALFDDSQPTIVRGDPTIGVVATVAGMDDARRAHIRLLVVDPARRGHGAGHELVAAAEADARAIGAGSLTTGADPPSFLWPGVPTSETALCALFERRHYHRIETNYDVEIDLSEIPTDPGGHRLSEAADEVDIDAFMAQHWTNWRSEVLHAHAKGNLVVAHDESGIAAFCAFEVNRSGFLGPVAVRPDLIGSGAGRNVLLGALWELRHQGRRTIDVSWVGPLVPYARVGGRIHTVYFVYRRDLD